MIKIHPTRCYECGGMVKLRSGTRRTMPYKNLAVVGVPASIQLPTCTKCGEQYIDEALAEKLDEALEAAYVKEMTCRAQDALEQISKHVTQQELERLIGLSQGYLSKVKSGQNLSGGLVSALLLIASDPKKQITRLRRALSKEAA